MQKLCLGNEFDLVINYTNIPYYDEEESDGDSIKTKPKDGTSRFYALRLHISNIKQQTLHFSYKICSKKRSFKRCNRFPNKINRNHWI